MKKINVICPICSKYKRLSVPENVFNLDQGSLLKLPIPEQMVCDHKFLVVLDYHFKIRDYEIDLSEHEFSNYLQKSTKEEFQFSFPFF